MSRVRVRRPLLALIALVVALAVGYTVKDVDSHHSSKPAATSSPAAAPPGSVAVSNSPSAPTPSAPRSSADPGSGGQPMSQMPVAVADTVHLIQKGGPYPYPKNDGVVFDNNEHILPKEPKGYYHEYTVPTPGASDRGTQRIVTGKNGAFYYTSDHYESFVLVDINR